MTDKAQHPNTPPVSISGSTSDKQRVFVSRSHELAQMFTKPAWHNPVKSGKFLENGLKPIEAFCSDIQRNLICWAVEGDSIFYRTPNYWYVFQLVPGERVFNHIFWSGYKTMGKIVWMTRYRNESWERNDDWANPHSVKHLGRDFLQGYPDKRLPLFDSGERRNSAGEIEHYDSCRPDYPEKEVGEAAQATIRINTKDDEWILQCADCGAYIIQDKENSDGD